MPEQAMSDLPPLIDRELFFGDPEISVARLSPDGRFVSFCRPFQGVVNIWVKGAQEPFDSARPITADTTRPVTAYFWTRDSRFVLYAQDKGGNEDFHIYRVDPTGSSDPSTGVPVARDLTPYDGVQARIYAVPKATPEFIVVGLNDRDPHVHDAYRLHVETGERMLLVRNEDNVASWQTDLDGSVRLGIRVDAKGGTEILRVHPEGLTVVYRCTHEESCEPLRFHKDSRRVYLITNKGDEVNLSRLVLFAPATGEVEEVESDPEGQVDFGGAHFSEISDELVATYYVGDRLRICPRDDVFARDLKRLRKCLPEGELTFVSRTRDERLHLVSVARDVDPGSVYLYDRENGEVTLQYRSRPDLPTEHLAAMKPVRYEARDGLQIPAYLTIPRGAAQELLPAVVLPHGGPWARDEWGYDPFAQFLSNRGYAVLQPNFRGSTGFGKAFLNAGNGEWGTGSMQHDITDGVRFLIEEGIADPGRVAIFGGSYGGYATLAGLAFTPDVYAAGVSYVGPSSILTLLESIPPYWGPVKQIFHVRVGNPEDPKDLQRLESQSPLHFADRIQAPLLVIQGANDPRVKKTESEQIVVALRELGRHVEYMLADDEGHGFAGRENRLAVAAALERFLAEHLGGRFQATTPDDVGRCLEALTVDVHSLGAA